jgi:hypothetical protein
MTSTRTEEAVPASVRSPDRLAYATRPLLAAIVLSRAVVLLAAYVAEQIVTVNPRLTSGDGAPILRSLTAWDGWWYLGIVHNGYHVEPLVDGYHDYAFLPLWPAIIRLLSWPWPSLAGSIAVVLSNVLFVVGLLILVRLGEKVVGPERAALGAILLAIFPFSAVFSMAYAESLFLCLSTGAFLAAERDRRALAGILVALAALTRLQGAVLALPVWLVLFLHDGRRLRPSQAWLILGPLAAVGVLAGVAILAGGPGAYGAAQAAWGRAGVGGGAPDESLASLLSLVNVVQLVTLLVAVFLLVYLRPDRIPAPYGLLTLLSLGLVFASGSLESIGRHVMSAFPYSWILAGRRARWFRLGWPVVSIALLFVLSTAMFAGRFVP